MNFLTAFFNRLQTPTAQKAGAPTSGTASPPASDAASGSEEYSVRSLLSEGTTFTGDLDAVGGIKIAGKVTGSVRCGDGALVLTGSTDGDAYAERAYIDGTVKGNLYAGRVFLGPNAVVEGAIYYGSMRMQEGASIVGDMHRVDIASLPGFNRDARAAAPLEPTIPTARATQPHQSSVVAA